MRVGLTGGIASGKSLASAILGDLGAIVIDYDQLAREVVQLGSAGLQAIVARFGVGVLGEDGELNRPALAEVVFQNPHALKDLEAITHPLIKQLAKERDEAAPSEAIVVHDNPLLVEMGGFEQMDCVIVIDVPVEVQLARMVELRNMTRKEAEERIDAQISREKRNSVADFVIDNTGSIEELKQELERVWGELRRQV